CARSGDLRPSFVQQDTILGPTPEEFYASLRTRARHVPGNSWSRSSQTTKSDPQLTRRGRIWLTALSFSGWLHSSSRRPITLPSAGYAWFAEAGSNRSNYWPP